jgi:phytoene dehydrogenase-like protein
MQVHILGHSPITLQPGNERWSECLSAFGYQAQKFWNWQERTADLLWDLALELPPWPPRTPAQLIQLIFSGGSWLKKLSTKAGWHTILPQIAGLAADAFRPSSAHLADNTELLRLFVDAQLLISTQATSQKANALFASAALDLPRRGVVNLAGGIGTIAEELTKAVRQNGGKVHFRQEVTRIIKKNSRLESVETRRGGSFQADIIVANLPPWNISRLLDGELPRSLKYMPPLPRDGWGAFVVYAGVDGSMIPEGFPLHHQIIAREPLGGGNSIFMSLSPEWDDGRAPAGRRAITLSTHTRLDPWWDLAENDRSAYEVRKQTYTERILDTAQFALPGFRQAVKLVLPGTPLTFQKFTHRVRGWVGGFPQSSLFRTWESNLGCGLYMVGDSIFPGQSIPAVAMGGMRVAQAILKEHQVDVKHVPELLIPMQVRRSP